MLHSRLGKLFQYSQLFRLFERFNLNVAQYFTVLKSKVKGITFKLQFTLDLKHLSELEICLRKMPQTLYTLRRKWKTY